MKPRDDVHERARVMDATFREVLDTQHSGASLKTKAKAMRTQLKAMRDLRDALAGKHTAVRVPEPPRRGRP